MAQAGDVEILACSRERKAIAVTLDADFHAILAITAALEPSVIRVRMQGLKAHALAEMVQQVLAVYIDSLIAGALVTVKPDKTRCHRLPIGRSD